MLSVKDVKDILTSLAASLRRLKGQRRRELAELYQHFPGSKTLKRYYVDPDCQATNPADLTDHIVISNPALEKISQWLDSNRHHSGVQAPTQLVLGDAGMGKSSLLIMLRLKNLLAFRAPDYKVELVRLGEGTLTRIAAINDPASTSLLLDALDEDPLAVGRIIPRVEELMAATRAFRSVILTCRTQFIPREMLAKIGEFRASGYKVPALYLSPFSDGQVTQYLDRAFPSSLLGGSHPDRQRAEKMVQEMQSLQYRPMLLANLHGLIEYSKSNRLSGLWSATSLYEAMLQEWLGREVAKAIEAGRTKPNTKLLLEACEDIAVWMERNNRAIIESHEVSTVSGATVQIPDLDLKGRALLAKNSDEGYRFAHYTIREFLAVRAAIGQRAKLTRTTPMMAEFIATQNERILLAGSNLANADFEGVNFDEAVFEDAVLEKANLTCASVRSGNLDSVRGHDLVAISADMAGASFVRADLRGAVLRRAILRECNLSMANLADSDLEEADLTSSCLAGSNFERAKLTSTTLAGCDMTGACFASATLVALDLSNARLSDANLSNANLRGSNLSRSRLKRANLVGADLAASNMENANLVEAKMSGACARAANLRETGLARAELREANLHRADLAGADLRGANLEGADLTRANLRGAILVGANLSNADLSKAVLKMANLQDAVLDGTVGLPRRLTRSKN